MHTHNAQHTQNNVDQVEFTPVCAACGWRNASGLDQPIVLYPVYHLDIPVVIMSEKMFLCAAEHDRWSNEIAHTKPIHTDKKPYCPRKETTMDTIPWKTHPESKYSHSHPREVNSDCLACYEELEDLFYLVDIQDDFVYTRGRYNYVCKVMEESYAGLTITTQERLTPGMIKQIQNWPQQLNLNEKK